MRDRGFNRSPTMCTDNGDKQEVNSNNGAGDGSAYYKEIEEILRKRNHTSSASVTATAATNASVAAYESSSHPHGDHNNNHDGNHLSAKVDPFLQFSDKGIDDASIPFGPIEANERPTLNLERRLDHKGHPLAITVADAVTGGGVPPSLWRDPGNDCHEKHQKDEKILTSDTIYDLGVTSNSVDESIHMALSLVMGYLGVRDLLSVELVCKSLFLTVQKDPHQWATVHSTLISR